MEPKPKRKEKLTKKERAALRPVQRDLDNDGMPRTDRLIGFPVDQGYFRCRLPHRERPFCDQEITDNAGCRRSHYSRKHAAHMRELAQQQQQQQQQQGQQNTVGHLPFVGQNGVPPQPPASAQQGIFFQEHTLPQQAFRSQGQQQQPQTQPSVWGPMMGQSAHAGQNLVLSYPPVSAQQGLFRGPEHTFPQPEARGEHILPSHPMLPFPQGHPMQHHQNQFNNIYNSGTAVNRNPGGRNVNAHGTRDRSAPRGGSGQERRNRKTQARTSGQTPAPVQVFAPAQNPMMAPFHSMPPAYGQASAMAQPYIPVPQDMTPAHSHSFPPPLAPIQQLPYNHFAQPAYNPATYRGPAGQAMFTEHPQYGQPVRTSQPPFGMSMSQRSDYYFYSQHQLWQPPNNQPTQHSPYSGRPMQMVRPPAKERSYGLPAPQLSNEEDLSLSGGSESLPDYGVRRQQGDQDDAGCAQADDDEDESNPAVLDHRDAGIDGNVAGQDDGAAASAAQHLDLGFDLEASFNPSREDLASAAGIADEQFE
ncbi:hypothetical protein F5Y18DRAFT_427530 [Xylariaceae sp. FL1019]|nr:hypothetical protein F5Y18DRAFT_427530 [Xylariaceae sp. FL1019]